MEKHNERLWLFDALFEAVDGRQSSLFEHVLTFSLLFIGQREVNGESLCRSHCTNGILHEQLLEIPGRQGDRTRQDTPGELRKSQPRNLVFSGTPSSRSHQVKFQSMLGRLRRL